VAITGNGVLPTLDAGFAGFLDSVQQADKADDVPKARNAVLDERVTLARATVYAQHGAAVAHGNVDTWAKEHNSYLNAHVAVPWANAPSPHGQISPDEVASTFRPDAGNETRLSGTYMLVRIIRMPRAVDIPINHRGFTDAVRRVAGGVDTDPADGTIVEAGLRLLDSGRANTLAPRWVGLWMEVRELFGDNPDEDDPSWPNRLRDRFGLPYLPVPSPLEILLLRYRVRELPTGAWRRGQPLLTVPSLLDGWLCEQFCPVPENETAGRAVNLEAYGDAPNREYLHAPMRHRPEHVYRVGTIDEDPKCDLLKARKVHIEKLRAVTQRADYAIGTDG
jgi:hypothetical protein